MKKFRFSKGLLITIYGSGLLCLLLGISISVIFSSKEDYLKVENVNLEKSIDDKELIDSYKVLDKKVLDPILYDTMAEAVSNAKYFPTSFYGKLTHYGPDCPLCGGHLGCNGQDARNGNIYYDDKEYGTVRIVAASQILPCGSIIRINVDAYDPDGMYAIVLDRGVSPGIIDLLKTSQRAKAPSRTVNKALFDIVRYGY